LTNTGALPVTCAAERLPSSDRPNHWSRIHPCPCQMPAAFVTV
jgi:hypothetical protein